MKQVAQSEHDLLTLARALVGEGSFALVEPLLTRTAPTPARLGPTALALLQDTLARGVVLQLARRGGARPARHLSGTGRLWDRHAAPALHFTRVTIDLLRWLLAGQATRARPSAITLARTASPGDALVAYLALDLTCGSVIARGLASDPLVRSLPLAWLGFPDLLAGAGACDLDASAWSALVAAPFLLEALQADLARRWVATERSKRHIVDAEAMRGLGAAQEAVLDAFHRAVDRAARRDLAGFVVEAAALLLARPLPPSAWIESLAGTGTLAARHSARRSAGAFLRALARWQDWDEQHRAVRFIDDGYDDAQLLLGLYEPFRRSGAAHAQTVLRAFDSLEMATS